MRYVLCIILYVMGVSAASTAGLTPKQEALLDTIAYAEGTNERYDVIYCYKYFKSYRAHPRRVVCCSKYCSSAAGRYQFLYKTWKHLCKLLNLKDFSPNNQDIAALFLVYKAGVDPDEISTFSSFKEAIIKLNKVWASLPESPYGQPTRSMDDLWRFYVKK